MEHDEAVSCQAAARYVTGELSPEGRDAFEAHFFDCAECAEEVRWEQIFAANVRAVSREEREERRPGWLESWRAWFSVRPVFALSLAANALLALGFGYVIVNSTHGAGTAPQLMASYFAAPPSRAVAEAKEIPAGASSFAVHFPMPDQNYPTYTYDILDASAKREAAGFLKAPATPERELYLEVPLKGLRAGVHTLVVRANSGNEIVAQFQFRISS